MTQTRRARTTMTRYGEQVMSHRLLLLRRRSEV